MFVELVLAALAIVALYYYLTSTYSYWESHGIKGPKPYPMIGTLLPVMRGKVSLGDYLHDIYKIWNNEKFIGIYSRRQPILVINDLEFIRDVLIKDFSKFVDRGNPMHEKVEPLSQHLFNLEPKRWRPLRLKLSPVFTSGKLKEMFYLLAECADHLKEFLKQKIDDNKGATIECREFTAKFTTDVIGVCAFGLQMNAMASEESVFRTMGRRIFDVDFKKLVRMRLRMFSPVLYDVVGRLMADTDVNNFFIDTTRQTMDYRKKNNVVKHDFVDLLMGIRDHPDKVGPDIEMTDTFMAAQLFVFFIAGFETSSTTMSNALYELALNPEIQKTLRQEIHEEMKRTGGVLEYEGIKKMKYIDQIFDETLRKYPPVTFLTRQAADSYTFKTASNDKVLTIEKGQKVWIPIYAIQRDARYFPDPEVFDPERFSDEAIKSRHPMSYLSFGDGPRNCIGKRFGVMQTKVGLVTILNDYRVEVCDKTDLSYVNNPRAFLLSPLNGIHVKFIKDTNNSI